MGGRPVSVTCFIFRLVAFFRDVLAMDFHLALARAGAVTGAAWLLCLPQGSASKEFKLSLPGLFIHQPCKSFQWSYTLGVGWWPRLNSFPDVKPGFLDVGGNGIGAVPDIPTEHPFNFIRTITAPAMVGGEILSLSYMDCFSQVAFTVRSVRKWEQIS